VGSIKQNAAKAEGYGLEADLQITPATGFTLGFGYAYLHTEFKNFADAAVFVPTPAGYVPAALDLSGEPLPRAPRHTGYASLTYDFDISADWNAGFTIIGRYTSSFDFNPGGGGPANLDRQKGYEQVNASLRVGPSNGRYQIGAFVNNLTDRRYSLLANTSATGTYIGVAPPRTYGMNVSVNF
jgi:iron complex outermembrane receptor protein